MTKNSILKTINEIMSLNNLVWFKHSCFQGTNPEQTNKSFWFIETDDYMGLQNEYEDCPDFNVLNQDELMFILSRVCGLHTNVALLWLSVDTFGPYAEIPYYHVEGMYEEA